MTTMADEFHRRTPPLDRTRVADVMHAGVIACPPETPLRVVARMLATNRIHCLVVFGDPRNFSDERAWRIVSDLDVVRALAAAPADRTAGDVATNPIHTIQPDDRLSTAAELMGDQGVTHLVVVDAGGEHPVGILSSLDIARAAAGTADRAIEAAGPN